MEIELLVNPNFSNAGEIQAELSAELHALQTKGISITSRTAPPPDGTLAFGEVVQFVIDHQDTLLKFIPLATAVLQVATAILKRRGVEPEKKKKAAASKKPAKQTSVKKKTQSQAQEPALIILVNNKHQLRLPCTPEQEKKFLKALRESEGDTKEKAAPKSVKRK